MADIGIPVAVKVDLDEYDLQKIAIMMVGSVVLLVFLLRYKF